MFGLAQLLWCPSTYICYFAMSHISRHSQIELPFEGKVESVWITQRDAPQMCNAEFLSIANFDA
jgi:hypothetical protein